MRTGDPCKSLAHPLKKGSIVNEQLTSFLYNGFESDGYPQGFTLSPLNLIQN